MKRGWKGIWIAAAAVAAAFLILLAPLPVRSAAPQEHIFKVRASRFDYSPGTLRVNPGDRVTVELEATDVVHGFSLEGYDIEMTADPGQTARLTFIADRPGTFRFHCSVTCGNMHPFMIGKFYVGSNLLLWRVSAVIILLLGLGMWKLWK